MLRLSAIILTVLVFTTCKKDELQPPQVAFDATPTILYEGETVSFTDKSLHSPYKWEWDFGNGSGSVEQNPVYAYNKPGKFSVTLTVWNASGSQSYSKPELITVNSRGDIPVANFTADNIIVQEGENVYFEDKSTNTPTKWNWNFGDASSSNEQNPGHVYNNSGKYTVTLIVTNLAGSDSITKKNYITVNPKGSAPIADFKVSHLNAILGWNIQFTNSSQNNPTSLSWDFGDGTSSSELNPSHTYTNTGSYTVTLTATNNIGKDSIIKENIVSIYNEGAPVDYDGNYYETVVIGSQEWTKENLKVTHYNDGTEIPYVSGIPNWEGTTADAYCWQNDDEETYKNYYGALYSYYVVETGKICPVNWHVPTKAEWETLINYLIDNGYGFGGSGDQVAKSLAATTTWINSDDPGDIGNDPSSNNSSGFSALAGGKRFSSGSFASKGKRCNIWSQTLKEDGHVYYFIMWNTVSTTYIDFHKKMSGHSIRCLKD